MDNMLVSSTDRPVSAERQAKLVRQFMAENFTADDLVGLARMIYVRVLFKLYSIAGGRGQRVTPLARQLTAEILREQVGFYVTAKDVQEFLDDEDDKEETSPPESRRNR
jgi:hypothetical protein